MIIKHDTTPAGNRTGFDKIYCTGESTGQGGVCLHIPVEGWLSIQMTREEASQVVSAILAELHAGRPYWVKEMAGED